MKAMEYEVTVRMRVATYSSQLEVNTFAEYVSEAVHRACYDHPHFIVEPTPTVEVTYATKR